MFRFVIICTEDIIIVDGGDIKPTSKGFRVEKKVAGQPRLRKTFPSFEEAEIALEKYIKGDTVDMPLATGTPKVTWRAIFDNAVKRKWRKAKTSAQEDNARRAIEKYFSKAYK